MRILFILFYLYTFSILVKTKKCIYIDPYAYIYIIIIYVCIIYWYLLYYKYKTCFIVIFKFWIKMQSWITWYFISDNEIYNLTSVLSNDVLPCKIL